MSTVPILICFIVPWGETGTFSGIMVRSIIVIKAVLYKDSFFNVIFLIPVLWSFASSVYYYLYITFIIVFIDLLLF